MLGTYGNIIIVLIYVYCSEIYAEKNEKLEFWSPNPELFDARRAQHQKNKTHLTKTSKMILRSKNKGQHAMYSKGPRRGGYRSTTRHISDYGLIDYDINLVNIRNMLNRRMMSVKHISKENVHEMKKRHQHNKDIKHNHGKDNTPNSNSKEKNSGEHKSNKKYDSNDMNSQQNKDSYDHEEKHHNKESNDHRDKHHKKEIKVDKDERHKEKLKENKHHEKEISGNNDKHHKKEKSEQNGKHHKIKENEEAVPLKEINESEERNDKKDVNVSKDKHHKRENEHGYKSKDINKSKERHHDKENHQNKEKYQHNDGSKGGHHEKEKQKDKHQLEDNQHKGGHHDKDKHKNKNRHQLEDNPPPRHEIKHGMDKKENKEEKLNESDDKTDWDNVKVLPDKHKNSPKKGVGRNRNSKLRTPRHDIHIRSTRIAPNVEPLDEQEKPGQNQEKTTHGPYYLNPHGLKHELEKLMKNFPHVNATFENLGRTAEYNDIIIIKVTEDNNEEGKYFRAEHSKYIDEVPEKKIIFIVHGLTVMGIPHLDCLCSQSDFQELLEFYFKHLDKFDIFVIPMANPDGYLAVHSHLKSIKNMSPQDACVGVLLDRNFDVAWNASKKVSSCSPLYPGPAPFSEVETRAIRDILHYFGHKIVAYIHVHAGTHNPDSFKGDAILYPRGYTDSQTDDDRYIDLKGEIEETMKNASFQVMTVTVDTLYNWYGKISGSSVDYASTVFGIPYSLEFVMQPYDNSQDERDADEATSVLALHEIWGRLIDTTFENIYKGTRGNEVKRKKK